MSSITSPDLYEEWMFGQFDALVAQGIDPFDESVDWDAMEAGLAQEWSCREEQRTQLVPVIVLTQDEMSQRIRDEYERNHREWRSRAAQPVKCCICKVPLMATQQAAPYCCYSCWPLLIASASLHQDTEFAAD